MDESNPRTSRFAHILQPIRDLSVNWSIDIANELEEYLDELESITFSFDDGATSLNFAEAALLIQGASCIYSKKVEFLYTLVYQALDFIEDKKRKEAGSGDKDRAPNTDDDYFMEDSFLNLDDVVEEATGIDLDETTERLVTPRTRPPAALLAFTDNQGGAQGDSERSGFKIATCSVHKSGALLLEDQDGILLDEDLRPRAAAEGTTTTIGGEPSSAMPSAAEDDDTAMAAPLDDEEDYYGGMGAADDDDDPIPEGDYDPPPQGGEGGAEEEEEEVRAARERRQQQQQEEEEAFDPYAPLDPHDTGALAVAPFRRGRAQMRARSRAGGGAGGGPAGAPAAPAGEVPAPGASGAAFPEFSAAYAQRRKEERAVTARARLQGARSAAAAAAPSAFAGAGGEDAVDEEDDYDYGGGYDPVDDDDDGGDEELALTLPAWGAIEDEIAAGHARNSAADEPSWHAAGEGPNGHLAPGEMSYEECVRRHVEAVVSAAAAAEVQTGLAGRVSLWKKKIEPQLEEQDARVPFDIHDYGARFLASFSKLPPIVAALEKAGGGPGGDEEAIDGGATGDVAVPFGAVVGGTEPYEASRTFAALLQLVNNGNVAIVKGASGGDESDNFDFTLVLESTHTKVLDFDEYRAPSAKEVGAAGKAGASAAKGVLAEAQ